MLERLHVVLGWVDVLILVLFLIYYGVNLPSLKVDPYFVPIWEGVTNMQKNLNVGDCAQFCIQIWGIEAAAVVYSIY